MDISNMPNFVHSGFPGSREDLSQEIIQQTIDHASAFKTNDDDNNIFLSDLPLNVQNELKAVLAQYIFHHAGTEQQDQPLLENNSISKQLAMKLIMCDQSATSNNFIKISWNLRKALMEHLTQKVNKNLNTTEEEAKRKESIKQFIKKLCAA